MMIGMMYRISSSLLRNRLIQFKMVHHAYLTLYRLHKMNLIFPLECWGCEGVPGDFSHIFWTCPIVSKFWEEVLSLIHVVIYIPLQSSMSISVLGLVKHLLPTVDICLDSVMDFIGTKYTTLLKNHLTLLQQIS